MKNLTTLLTVASLAIVPVVVNAKKPHPESNYVIDNLSCECVWAADSESSCTVTWDDADAPAYGVSVEFEATWVEEEEEQEESTSLDLDDDWECDEGEGGSCTATKSFIMMEYGEEYTVEVEAKVKGFDNGRNGPKSRDFIKTSASCNSPDAI